MSREVLIRRVYRTGVQTVECEGALPLPDEPCTSDCRECSAARRCLLDAHYFITLKNRTNDTRYEVPAETAWRYYQGMSA